MSSDEPVVPGPAPWYVVVIAYLVVAIAIGLLWWSYGGDEVGVLEITAAEGFAALGIFYLCAQAVERIVEPIMTWEPWGSRDYRQQLKKEVSQFNARLVARSERAEPAGGSPDDVAGAAAQASAKSTELAEEEKKRGLIAWAIAAVLAVALTGLMELRLVDAVADITVDGDPCVAGAGGELSGTCARIARVDLVVTALAIAGGTKPLHDLISRLEKAKSNADPATGSG